MARTVDGRLAYADLLRVLATIAVIVLHISAGWLGQTAVGSTEWTVLCTYDALVRWSVPMFVMLSGAFLLDPKKSVNLRDIFFKYILRVLVALLVWGSFYALLDYGHSNWHFTWAGIKSAFGYVLRSQTHYHLWFLYMIIGLYLVTPILRAFVRGASRGTFHWFFALTFVVCSLLPTLQSLWPSQISLPMAWLNKLDIHLVLGYVGYYVAGYYLKNYTLGRLAEFILYILGILGTASPCGGPSPCLPITALSTTRFSATTPRTWCLCPWPSLYCSAMCWESVTSAPAASGWAARPGSPSAFSWFTTSLSCSCAILTSVRSPLTRSSLCRSSPPRYSCAPSWYPG